MCGIVVGRSYAEAEAMLEKISYRGPDGQGIVGHGKWFVGQTRLAIVDLIEGFQPLVTATGVTAFNGEIYNYGNVCKTFGDVWEGARTEVRVLDRVMDMGDQFIRVLDGDYAVVRVEKGTGDLVVGRDWVGVVPLYLAFDGKYLTGVASEKKCLHGKLKEVRPGQVLRFDRQGRLKKRWQWDPISLHCQDMDIDRLTYLFKMAVAKRIVHSDVPVTIALSGGLDSSLILKAATMAVPLLRNKFRLSAVTVAIDGVSDEVNNARQFAYGLNHKVVVVTRNDVFQYWDKLQYHLEDKKPNPIKWRGMVRNYFVAQHAPAEAKVILCGEGADEVFCGYPSHHNVPDGLPLEWKSLSTFRSMPAINLDRVNKGGLAWGKEYRVPFLDRDLVLYAMSCRKSKGKTYLKQMANQMGLPPYILNKPKYGNEEKVFGELYDQVVEKRLR